MRHLPQVEVVQRRSPWRLNREGLLMAEVRKNLVWLLRGKPQMAPQPPLVQLAAGCLTQLRQAQQAPAQYSQQVPVQQLPQALVQQLPQALVQQLPQALAEVFALLFLMC